MLFWNGASDNFSVCLILVNPKLLSLPLPPSANTHYQQLFFTINAWNREDLTLPCSTVMANLPHPLPKLMRNSDVEGKVLFVLLGAFPPHPHLL